MDKPNPSEITKTLPVPAPMIWPDANQRLILGAGAPIDPMVRLETFSPKEFENFVYQWADEYLRVRYRDVEMRAGAGDKGRDIVGWLDHSGTQGRRWDNYQCKHYASALAPTDVYVELGKLCFYTHRRDFSVPEKYYFVCNKGVGTKLADAIAEPDKLRDLLKANWLNYCEPTISQTQKVKLEGALLDYIDRFEFSIFDWLKPAQLLEEHSKTRYHALTFGTQLKKRPPAQQPPNTVALKETRYVKQIYEAYSDHKKITVSNFQDVQRTGDTDLPEHFHESRKCFYFAETLREFARDNLPKQEDFFADLTERILSGVKSTLWKPYQSGYVRMLAVAETAGTLQLGYHVLNNDLLPEDRVGICHQLANEDKLKWVRENDAR